MMHSDDQDATDRAWHRVLTTLLVVFDGDAASELDRLQAAAETAGVPAERALLHTAAAMAAVIACRFDRAAEHGARAIDAGHDADPPIRRLAGAVVLMCDGMAGTRHAQRWEITLEAERSRLEQDGPGRLLSAYLLAEAALSTGATDLLDEILAAAGLEPGQAVAPGEDEDAPIDGAALTLQLLLARALAYRGRGVEVREIARRLDGYGKRVPIRAHTVLLAIASYGAAQGMDREAFAALASVVLERTRGDVNYLSVGSCLYVAWGLRTLGQVQRAAALLTTTAGPQLERCKIWDRALVSEILLEAALGRGDLFLAETLLERARALLHFPIAGAALARAESLAAVADGHVRRARSLALAASRHDEASGSPAEALRGRLVHAAVVARADAAAAADLLAGIAAEADGLGIESTRTLAAHRWRQLSAAVPGLRGTLAVLTARQRQIAVLVGEGSSNVEIAQVLFLSPRTVQTHVADVFAVTGARSRAEIAAMLARPVAATGVDPLAGLSARQREIARLIARGRRNREIADGLGISVKTVENHVSVILRRLGVRSRAAIAARAAG